MDEKQPYTIYDGLDGIAANLLLEKGKPVNKENVEKAKRDMRKMVTWTMEESKMLDDGIYPCLWFHPFPHLEILEDEEERYVPFGEYLKEQAKKKDG